MISSTLEGRQKVKRWSENYRRGSRVSWDLKTGNSNVCVCVVGEESRQKRTRGPCHLSCIERAWILDCAWIEGVPDRGYVMYQHQVRVVVHLRS